MHFGQRAKQTENGQRGLRRATGPGQGRARLQAQVFLVMLTANMNPGNKGAEKVLHGNRPIEKPAECD